MRGRGRRRRAAAPLAAAGAAIALGAALGPAAQGATFALTLSTTGFCTPAPADGTALARTVHATGLPAAPTKPIAILDTGVDSAVPQLAGRVLPGYDALTGGPVSTDADGHGTMAAGVAASAGPGTLGVSPASPILPVRLYPTGHTTTADALAKAVGVAVQHGAGVISIGGSGPLSDATPTELLAVSKAIGDAVSNGVLVVAGAGDSDQAYIPQLPGSLPHVLTIGSVNGAGARSTTSIPHPWVDLVAPGEDVFAPLAGWCNMGFGSASGTSLAAPALAGAAALVQAQRPGLTTQQLFELLRRAGDDLGEAGRDNDTGFGMLDVAKALSALPQSKESLPEVDDDPYWVRGRYAKAHPPLLTARKLRFKVSASVGAAKDPADVYRVQLVARERMVVTVNAANPGALLELAIYGPRAGDFDVSNGVTRNLLLATGGVSDAPQLEYRAKRSGTYYLAVETSDAFDPDDPQAVPSDQEPYQISAFAQRKKAKKKPKHHATRRPAKHAPAKHAPAKHAPAKHAPAKHAPAKRR